jgi:hypothetical protein
MIVWLCQLSGHYQHNRPGTRDDRLTWLSVALERVILVCRWPHN